MADSRHSEFEYQLREARARVYDHEYTKVHGAWLSKVEALVLRRLLALTDDDVLLELGCGTGRITRLLAPMCKEIFALDRSESSLDVLRSHIKAQGLGNITVLRADATAPMSTQHEATKAIAVQLLQHVPSRAKRLVVLRNMFVNVRPGGRCATIDEIQGVMRRLRGLPQELNAPNELFFHAFEEEEIRGDYRGVGFTNVDVAPCGVLYWLGYPLAPHSLVRIDSILAAVPFAPTLAKFAAVAGERPA